MRVLHVAPDLSRAFGGPTQALLGFLSASRAVGIDTEVVAPEPPVEDRLWFERLAPNVPVHVFHARGRGSARVSMTLLRFLRSEGRRFDVIHIHGLFNGISTFAAHSCRRARIPYVIGPFGTLSHYTFAHKRRLLKHAYHLLADAPAIRAAAAMHFTTVQERDEARRLPAVRAVPAAVVPPPWVPDTADAIGEHKPNGDGRAGRAATVLFLSRIHPIKGLEVLLDAWPAVWAARPGVQLVIAGSGDVGYERKLKARVVQGESAQSVRFTGFVTGAEKARWLDQADVFVLPSHHENFGVAVLEAIASGIPAVITPEVQISGLVAQYGLGAVVPRDPASVAQGILSVLDDSKLRARCAAEGSALARSLFTPQSVGTRLRAMYDLARAA
jgi:glycosyltransferase involved in cell wall biosynthesis